MNGVSVSNFELVIYTLDQKPVELLLNVTPRTDEKGRVVGVVGVGQVCLLGPSFISDA